MSNVLSKRTDWFPSLWNEFVGTWNNWADQDGAWKRTATVPAVNITEHKNEYKLKLAAPGLKKSDFKIDIRDGVLNISCENESSSEEKTEKHTRKEYNYSSFSRSFTLPEEVDQNKISAHYEDGILKMELPKLENAKKSTDSRPIEVK